MNGGCFRCRKSVFGEIDLEGWTWLPLVDSISFRLIICGLSLEAFKSTLQALF
jgi:hypothetical protein